MEGCFFGNKWIKWKIMENYRQKRVSLGRKLGNAGKIGGDSPLFGEIGR
jgi:hypothetical protein